MEEKSAEASATTDENQPTITSVESDDNSAGNATVDPVQESQGLMSAEVEDVQFTEPTEEESNVEVVASLISIDTNTNVIEGSFNSEDGLSADATALSETSTDIIPIVSEEVNDKSVDNTEEETNGNNVNLSDSMGIESTEVVKNEISIDNESKSEEKLEPVPQVDPNNAVYQLEEELKRLHGDTSDENKIDNFMGDLSVTSILEDKVDTTNKKDNGDNTTTNTNSLLTVRKLEEQPIMKDSDLEEMLSAGDVIKEPLIIKEAQNELKTTDILVCGRCHEVYHFVEEFQNHKSQLCTAKSTILPICEGESKPQVWGFTLWKTRQNKLLKPGETIPTSWRTYQKWCKLAPIDKNAWISAGQAIQFCHKIGSAKLSEVKAKGPNLIEKDPLSLDGFESNKENANLDTSRNTRIITKAIKSEPVLPSLPKTIDVNTNKALRTPSKCAEKSEFAVERIVAKRFNAKKKCWEYQIKWEHFPSDQNTWEPLSNLTHCKKMVDLFEEQLKKLKADKAKQVGLALKNRKPTLSTSSMESSSAGRPQRSSKQKALNQVKAWCGNISDDDVTTGLKRKLEDDDSDDSFEKKIKTEDFSDDSDFDINTVANAQKVPPLRKIPQKQTSPGIQILKNGLDKSGPLPHNILIPDANGVVRINQKQLPSLSTGVYIMSKTAGIIKLDSTTSKVATSGGQTIVKVAPKIGQTQIKIVKKDGSTTATTKQIGPQSSSTPMVTKVYKPIITKVKRSIESPKKIPEIVKVTPEGTKKTEPIKKVSVGEVKKQVEPTKSTPPQHAKFVRIKEEPKKTLTSMMDMSAPEDDSDDGLEELPFPEEIKIPEPESPQGEFILDPVTGKIAGMEYPEKTEPEDVEPDPEPMEEEKSDITLENIVKLAAADITEDDLKNDDPMDLEMGHHEDEDEDDLLHIPHRKQQLLRQGEPITTPSIAKTIVRMPVGATNRSQMKPQHQTSRQQGSLLNKVLTGTPIIRRNPPQVGSNKVQQRVVNQSVLKSAYGTIVRVGNTTYVRKSAITKKPKQVISSPSTRIIKAHHDPAGKNVYTYSRQAMQGGPRKIGNTTIRQAASLDMLAEQQKLSSSASLIANRPPISPSSITTQTVRRVVHTNPGMHSSMATTAVSPAKRDALIRQQQEQQRKVVMPSSSRPPKPIQHIQSPVPVKPKPVINMPSLLGDDEPEVDSSPPELTKPASPSPASPFSTPVISTSTSLLETSAMESIAEPIQDDSMTGHTAEESINHQTPSPTAEADGTNSVSADLSSFTLADNENPIFITGDDGTVYQVAGQNEQGQTILLTQGSDGQQQCLLVTSEVADAMETSTHEQEQPPQEVQQPAPEISEDVTQPLSIKTDTDTNDQVVAQVVRAEPPSPGGTHKVVVMLPDGKFMVTQVTREEYESLELE